MKPQLVDLDYFYKEKNKSTYIKEIPPSQNKRNVKPFHFQSFINMIGLLTILTGFFFLYKRKESKEKTKRDLRDRIDRLKNIIENY